MNAAGEYDKSPRNKATLTELPVDNKTTNSFSAKLNAILTECYREYM